MNKDCVLKESLQLLEELTRKMSLSGGHYFWIEQDRYWKWEKKYKAVKAIIRASGREDLLEPYKTPKEIENEKKAQKEWAKLFSVV